MCRLLTCLLIIPYSSEKVKCFLPLNELFNELFYGFLRPAPSLYLGEAAFLYSAGVIPVAVLKFDQKLT